MKISYGITVHNEADELNKLLEILIHKTDEEDEIVICDDFSNDETIRNSIEQDLEIEEIIHQCNALFAYGTEDNFVNNSGIKGEKITYDESEPRPGRRHTKIPKKSIISIKLNKSSNLI